MLWELYTTVKCIYGKNWPCYSLEMQFIYSLLFVFLYYVY